uniref:GPI inositol-deacylase n=1 Tax=Phytophthora ramorum TaxID=164328 RepID=H3GW81_PHYRM
MAHARATLFVATALMLVLSSALSPATPSQDSPPVHRQLSSSLADAPSLRLQFTLKRTSMNVYGQSEFYVFANPVVSSDNTSVLYDGHAAFTNNGTEYTFLLVDGIAYYVASPAEDNSASETARCLDASTIPPLNAIVEALNNVTTISSVSASDETIKCSSGKLFKVSFGGADFALCASGASGFTIYGSDLDIAVEYLEEPVEISAPTLDAGAAAACETVITPTSATATTQALLTGGTISSDTRRKLKAEADVTLSSSSCSCSSTPRPCVFFRGMGSTTEDTTLQTTSDYWGDIEEHAPCCSSFSYAVLNTVDYAWTDAAQQEKVCNLALAASSTSSTTSRVVADTIVVTHSMGGLMVAGALANASCSFASSTTWISMSPPMGGSMSSDYQQGACSGSNVFLEAIATLIGRCPATTASKSLAYEGESYSTTSLDNAYEAAQEAYRSNVDAAVCSDNYSGLLSTDQLVYKLAGSVIPHKSSENDGIVEYQSCAGGLSASKFGNTYDDTFYLTGLNHADTTFRHGDALVVNSQKPVKWFECLL